MFFRKVVRETRMEREIIDRVDLINEFAFPCQGQPDRVAHQHNPAERKLSPEQDHSWNAGNEIPDPARQEDADAAR
jgi:hypothetical protein